MEETNVELLNDEMLCEYVKRPEPIVKDLKTPTDWFDKNSPVQPSSIDLHIGSIFIPGTKHGMKGSEDGPLATHTLGPGETAIITTLETLDLPSDIAAIGFPPSRVSVQGLLMTNPGHVDPGYKGQMHFAVINMGKEEFSLRNGAMIVTLLFFEMSLGSKKDYSMRTGPTVPGRPKQEDINRLSAEFLDVTGRAKRVAKEEVQSFEMRRTIVVGIITVVLAAATYLVPLLTGIAELKEKVARLEQEQSFVSLGERVKVLETRLKDQPAPTPDGTIPSRTKPPKSAK
jgi:dCTP deaminase